jgi:hypothetical protein
MNGKRDLNKDHIAKLSERFHVFARVVFLVQPVRFSYLSAVWGRTIYLPRLILS